MAGQTTKGILYPTSNDNIAPLETWLHTLATDADNAGVISGSKTFTGPASAGSSVTVTVTVSPVHLSTPNFFAVVQGSAAGSPYICNVYGTPTPDTFFVKVYRVAGSTAESLKLVWMASTYDI
jgi:hypothetical protein